jgi:hypothetical protein
MKAYFEKLKLSLKKMTATLYKWQLTLNEKTTLKIDSCIFFKMTLFKKKTAYFWTKITALFEHWQLTLKNDSLHWKNCSLLKKDSLL